VIFFGTLTPVCGRVGTYDMFVAGRVGTFDVFVARFTSCELRNY